MLSIERVYPLARQVLISLFAQVPPTAFTDQLLSVFERMGQPPSEIDLLPLRICEHQVKSLESAVPLCLAWQLLRFSAKFLDDAEDEADFRPTNINLGTGFLLTAQQALLQLQQEGFDPIRVQAILQRYNLAALKACSGQHQDLTAQAQPTWIDPDTWLAVAQAKSGEPFAWATWAGACLAGLSDESAQLYHQYGYHLGVLLQISDDYQDIWGSNASNRSFSWRSNLPCLYAHFVASSDQQLLLEQTAQAPCEDPERIETLRSLLVSLGTQKYILAACWLQKQKALEALSQDTQAPNCHAPLHRLLDQVLPFLS